jgi:hypothetical protein
VNNPPIYHPAPSNPAQPVQHRDQAQLPLKQLRARHKGAWVMDHYLSFCSLFPRPSLSNRVSAKANSKKNELIVSDLSRRFTLRRQLKFQREMAINFRRFFGWKFLVAAFD